MHMDVSVLVPSKALAMFVSRLIWDMHHYLVCCTAVMVREMMAIILNHLVVTRVNWVLNPCGCLISHSFNFFMPCVLFLHWILIIFYFYLGICCNYTVIYVFLVLTTHVRLKRKFMSTTCESCWKGSCCLCNKKFLQSRCKFKLLKYLHCSMCWYVKSGRYTKQTLSAKQNNDLTVQCWEIIL